MKYAKLAFLLLPAALFCTTSAFAGDSVYAQHIVRAHSKWESQPQSVRRAAAPFVFVARAWETFLHSPQILAEGIEGDRALINHRGFLAPREVPVEDCIISPAD